MDDLGGFGLWAASVLYLEVVIMYCLLDLALFAAAYEEILQPSSVESVTKQDEALQYFVAEPLVKIPKPAAAQLTSVSVELCDVVKQMPEDDL